MPCEEAVLDAVAVLPGVQTETLTSSTKQCHYSLGLLIHGWKQVLGTLLTIVTHISKSRQGIGK